MPTIHTQADIIITSVLTIMGIMVIIRPLVLAESIMAVIPLIEGIMVEVMDGIVVVIEAWVGGMAVLEMAFTMVIDKNNNIYQLLNTVAKSYKMQGDVDFNQRLTIYPEKC